MKTIVIYGGRFHPFHKGHAGVYKSLVKQFPEADVYVVSSGKQEPGKSPFSFNDKIKMMQALGVPASNIVQVKNPYTPTEVTSKYDQDSTTVIFAISEKDSTRFSFKPKKDGSPSYMQPYKKGAKLQPLSKFGYVQVLPTTETDGISSASQVRDIYVNGNDKVKAQLLTKLYGSTKLKKVFDKALHESTELREFIQFINKFRL